MNCELSASDRGSLLRLARAAIMDAVCGENLLAELLEGTGLSPGMRATRGVFVTLKHPDPGRPGGFELRGCIGKVLSLEPLYRTLLEVAPRAAQGDPRFPPVPPDELPAIRIGISALTPPTRLTGIDDLVIGRDGVRLVQGPRQAVFLPQVAEEQGWDRRRLLQQLAVKAGLAKQDWNGAELSVFQTEQFAEPM